MLIDRLTPGAIPGIADVEKLLSPGLTIVDDQGTPRMLLAELAPTLENGLWKVLPDGRMETTWRISPRARWHDGVPVTSADVLFTWRLESDREVPMRRHVAVSLVERVETPDPATVTVWWKSRYIEADGLFRSPLFPRHLLETTYLEDKAAFTLLPYFTEEFVGAGPFELRQFVRSSHMVLTANEAYLLGRPKIDEIEVKFIPDGNTVLANILAGSVELTLGRSVALEQFLSIRDQWREGGIDIAFTAWIVIFPQFLGPNPAVVLELPFRRALMHAMDRPQMAESLQAGLVPVADTFVHPNDPEYRDIEHSIVRYPYDSRRTIQLIEGLGYTRGPDGFFRDRSNTRLAVEIRTGGAEVSNKATFAVADYWRSVGIDAEPMIMPEQRRNYDREWVQNFPGFLMYRQPNAPAEWITRLHSTQTPLPENNYFGRNHPRYMNPDFDALIDKFYATIPRGERMQVLAQIVQHTTDQLNTMGLFYDSEPIAVGRRLRNVAAMKAAGSTPVWNADRWEVRS
jgi:peptide/nickel transport system substrate-binding protein